MNTESDYLWDKSGEPDPEIKELEEILGSLSHQAREWEIPADLEVGGKRRFFRNLTPMLAIAAAITLLVFGLALWFGLQRLQTRAKPEVVQSSPASPAAPASAPAMSPNRDQFATLKPKPQPTTNDRPALQGINQPLVARTRKPGRPVDGATRNQQSVANQEGQVARDQLFLALRVASMKLNFAQKKTQGTNPKDVQNQHRIG